MSSSDHQDMLSNLPDVILIMILSLLPFKESVCTSVLSRRWRTICHHTKNICFRETEYVDPFVHDPVSLKYWFVHYACTWVSRFEGDVIDTFELYLRTPVGFLPYVEFLIEFAASKRVKNLVLDFSDPRRTRNSDAFYVELPLCVYGLLPNLESLKIFGCTFDPLKFATTGLPRSFSVGWISLPVIDDLISNSPKLESLVIDNCWDLYLSRIAGNMKEVVLRNCLFTEIHVTFDLPNVVSFRYSSGYVLPFYFKRLNIDIEEAYLDLGSEKDYDEPSGSTVVDGDVLSGFLNSFRNARTLSVCPYLLQCIQECQNPGFALHPVETRHLVLRTRMHAKEYGGITHLLSNCPHLETLTLDLQPPRPSRTAVIYGNVNADLYWTYGTSYQHFPRRLKAVVVKNYNARLNELSVMRFLVGSRLRPGFMLNKVDVYMVRPRDGSHGIWADATMDMLRSITEDVQVVVHNA